MSSAVSFLKRDGLAVLSINHPPVNSLSSAVRKGLFDGVKRCMRDGSVRAIIITGAGKTYCGGADITEFSGTSVNKEPSILDVGGLLESCEKPVVSAIHGYAFGGGLELALFCHYRVALRTARFGFPEVALGLLPGANGTQRLPRVAPLDVAMEMIASGQPITAQNALKYGIIDKIVEGDIVDETVQFTTLLMRQPVNLDSRRLRLLPVKNLDKKDQIFEEALTRVKKRSKGVLAPVHCLKAVKSAADLSYEDGLRAERDLFQQLFTSAQAKALQYAFFSDRLISRWELPSKGDYRTGKALPVKTVAVVGAGTMGSGIAVALLTASFKTLIIDQNPKLLESGVARIRSLIEGGVKLGKRTPQQAQKALSLLKPVNTMQDLKDVDLVIEAVFEDMSVKQKMFKELDAVCKPATILCTNTSTLDIDRISSATKRPDKVIGTHFFVPAYYMRLLENIYGRETSLTTTATVMELGRRLNKITVLVGNCHGFCANRLNSLLGSEAVFLLEEGALPEQVDQVLEEFGFPIGTFKVADLSGLDIGWRIRQEVLKDAGLVSKPGSRINFIQGNRASSIRDLLYEMGRLGRKSGAGFYRYDKPGGKEAYADEAVKDVILKYCRDNGLERRNIPTQEILERCIYSVINEGFLLLEEGIVSRPEEIDVCWLHGFSFPRYQGGPMFYAQQVGLKRIYEKVCHYYQQHPTVQHWQPSELLKRLALKNEPLKNWKSCLTRDSKL